MIYRVFFPLFPLLFFLAAGLAHAQQYRWIDKDGRVQFTDAPPPAGAKDVRRTNVTTAKPGQYGIPGEAK